MVAVDKGRIAGDNMYRYCPRVNRIVTPFMGLAVDVL